MPHNLIDVPAWLALAVLRLILSFLRAVAVFSIAWMVGFMALFCVVAILTPLGETITVLGGVAFLILAPEFAHLLPAVGRPKRQSAVPEPEGRAPSLPAVPVRGHGSGVSEVYRGHLTTLPRE
jgi:hypothetical protein